jgi:hypothetical protein
MRKYSGGAALGLKRTIIGKKLLPSKGLHDDVAGLTNYYLA